MPANEDKAEGGPPPPPKLAVPSSSVEKQQAQQQQQAQQKRTPDTMPDLTKPQAEKLPYKRLKELCSARGITLPLGTSRDEIIDLLTLNPSNANGNGQKKERPWKAMRISQHPQYRRYLKLLKIVRLDEIKVYDMMVRDGCATNDVNAIFGTTSINDEKKQQTDSKLIPDTLPRMGRNKTEEFHPSSHPAHPIDSKQPNVSEWNKMEVAKKSESGSSGVIFCLLPKGVVVLKSGNSLGEEMFGGMVAELLGLNVPKIRLVSHRTGEYAAVQNSVRGKVSIATRVAISRILQRQNLGVMEFVKGKSLVTMEEYPKKDALKQIGGILALDVVLNNFDRLPFIWHNSGNVDNIFYSDGNMFALDNRVVCPTSQTARDHHLQKVELLCKNFKKGTITETKEWVRLQECFSTRTYMGHLRKERLQEIAQGFEETVDKIVEKLTLEKLDSILYELEREIPEVESEFWSAQIRGIDSQFIFSIVQMFKKYFHAGK
mmetsp:Transcript_868/g.1521  ORF Transcript_868/g.1521 Transcript_868/m.1521 type:complete len:488 (-) Transcript_868:215-1678(-)